jgi:serine/threonine protein kinase
VLTYLSERENYNPFIVRAYNAFHDARSVYI